MPDISIVCVTHNRKRLALRCLESCQAQTARELEIVLVVNGHTDDTADAVRSAFPDIHVLQTDKNIGFFPALNMAIARAQGEFVMTVDDDAWFTRADAVDLLVAALRAEPELAAVTCSIEGPAEQPPARSDRYVAGFKTGFTMLRRCVFTEWVGYYPELFFRSGGENYLCTALWDSGRRVKQLAPVLMHHEQAAAGRSKWDWTYYGLRSQILVVFMRDPWWMISPRLILKWARSLAHCAKRGQIRPWFWAWLTVWIHVPAALRLRRPIHWHTQRLLWRLKRRHIGDSRLLPPTTGRVPSEV